MHLLGELPDLCRELLGLLGVAVGQVGPGLRVVQKSGTDQVEQLRGASPAGVTVLVVEAPLQPAEERLDLVAAPRHLGVLLNQAVGCGGEPECPARREGLCGHECGIVVLLEQPVLDVAGGLAACTRGPSRVHRRPAVQR